MHCLYIDLVAGGGATQERHLREIRPFDIPIKVLPYIDREKGVSLLEVEGTCLTTYTEGREKQERQIGMLITSLFINNMSSRQAPNDRRYTHGHFRDAIRQRRSLNSIRTKGKWKAAPLKSRLGDRYWMLSTWEVPAP